MIELLSKNIYYLNKKYIGYLNESNKNFKMLNLNGTT